jgi:hypothetical protein
MNFAFEDCENLLNFINSKEVCLFDQPIYSISPFVRKALFERFNSYNDIIPFLKQKCPDELRKLYVSGSNLSLKETLPLVNKFIDIPAYIVNINSSDPYIISTSVGRTPYDWAGGMYSKIKFNKERKGIFENLNSTYLEKLQNKKALLLIDQSLEGYHADWIWEFFHKSCNNFNISPSLVIYMPGNLLADTQYNKWVIDNNIKERINVIPFVNFETIVKYTVEENNQNNNFNSLLNYKKEHLQDIKVYNCLNKRDRLHRAVFYLYLYNNNLLDYGLVSMQKIERHRFVEMNNMFTEKDFNDALSRLPIQIYNKNNKGEDITYINRIVDQVYKDSWVSIVSEASYYKKYVTEDETIFISEKTFKSIACKHPFIILGNKGSLEKLKELGYKTFEGFIDETYDKLSDTERFESIINSLKKIITIDNKISWYNSMEEIIEHNYNLLMNSVDRTNYYIQQVNQIYRNQFR